MTTLVESLDKWFSDRGSIPLASTKKFLLEPLYKSKVSGEDFFIVFLKSGRWGVRVNQHRRFRRNVPEFFSFWGNEDCCLSLNPSPLMQCRKQASTPLLMHGRQQRHKT